MALGESEVSDHNGDPHRLSGGGRHRLTRLQQGGKELPELGRSGERQDVRDVLVRANHHHRPATVQAALLKNVDGGVSG